MPDKSTSMDTPFALTDSAVQRIAFLLNQESESDSDGDTVLRIAVDGGGCSGFQYKFDFDKRIAEDDMLLEKDGAKVAVDSVSLPFLDNAVLDYVETLGAAHFEIRNPNASATCGCGNSFAV